MTANQRTALFFLLASVSLATAFHLTSASAQLLVSAFDKPSPETEHDLLDDSILGVGYCRKSLARDRRVGTEQHDGKWRGDQ